MRREEALQQFRQLTGLPLAEDGTPYDRKGAMKWFYGDPTAQYAVVHERQKFGASRTIKSLELTLAEDAGAIKLMLRLSPRHKELLTAFLVRNGGVDLQEPLPIDVEEITMRLQRVVCGADDPA